MKIALLRGINVGGKRKIFMSDLKSLFQDLGFEDISTYIQSGNIIFSTSDEDNHNLTKEIHEAIKEKFGFDVPVLVRNLSEWKKIVENNPFAEKLEITPLHLTFLSREPSPKEIEMLKESIREDEPDQFVIQGKEIYLCCQGKYHKSKLSNQFFEKKLNVQATTRNWKTVLKLYELGA